MPVVQKWHYVCPITQIMVAQDDNTALPARWAKIGDEVFSPQGMYVLAHRLLAHSEAAYTDLMTSQYPSTAFDDWVSDTVPGPTIP